MQNFITLSAAIHELSCVQRKNSDENNTVHRYGADSNDMVVGISHRNGNGGNGNISVGMKI